MKSRIMIVDDDPDIRKAISMLLEDTYDISLAADGEGALQSVLKERPQFMLLDLSMPVMDGIQVLENLRLLGLKIPVVMLTSRDEIDLAQRALTLGAAAFITKPVEMDYLRAEIRRLIEKTAVPSRLTD